MKTIPYDADLHNHTTASDGALSPAELVEKAETIGIAVLGITDHDTIEGVQEAIHAARNRNIEILPGMEITVSFSEPFFTGSLHLLAYFCHSLLDNPGFVSETASVLSSGRGQALILSRIRAINHYYAPGSPEPLLPRALVPEDLTGFGNRISRRHFARAIQAMGLEEQRIVTRILSNHSPAYVPSGSSLDLLRGYVTKWPLTLVLAHPAAGSYPGDNLYREVLPPFEIVDMLMDRFIDIGVVGVEVEYPGHTPEWKERLRTYIQSKHLAFETGGSDCHDERDRPIGLAGTGLDAVDAIRRYWR